MPRVLAILVALVVLAGCSSTSGTISPTVSAAATSTASAAATAASAAKASTSADPDSRLVDIGAGLEGPTGLAATVYATGLTNASAFAFDAQGRLWVATAAYSDADTDAVYLVPAPGSAPIKVIADVHTPLGLLWFDGVLYVASGSSVVAYRDLDGTSLGQHDTIVTFATGTGELNGLTLGSDGRIRLGISAPCDACTPTLPDSASIVSFKPDGSDLRVDVRGIRAPIALVYDAVSGDLYTTINQRDDLAASAPGDLLAVVSTGQDWRFPECYTQGGADCAGVPDPVAKLDPHAGVSGLAIVDGQLGAAIGHAALAAEWAQGRVVEVALDGRATVTTFLLGLSQPMPMILAPDGSVLVADWGSGTVYRIALA
jgi:glucose/arabinose dehydrogenase